MHLPLPLCIEICRAMIGGGAPSAEQSKSRAEQEQSRAPSVEQSKSKSRAPSAEQSKSRAEQENLPSEEELIFRRRHAGGRRPGDVTQAVRRRRDASWRPRDPGGMTQAGGRRHDASGGVTQAAVAARLEH